jgi:hypothetical protein
MLNWSENFKAAQEIALPQVPEVAIPQGAGVKSGTLVAIQCVVRCSRGKVSGCATNVESAWHRIMVARCHEIAGGEIPADVYDLFRQKVGRVSTDRAMRPKRRMDLVMRRVNPSALTDARPWNRAYSEVKTALEALVVQATRHKREQFALLLVCTISDGREVTPRNTAYEKYDEHEILGIFAAEAVILEGDAGETQSEVVEEDEFELGGYKGWGR